MLTKAELKELVTNKTVYIWGTKHTGKMVKCVLDKWQISSEFCDNVMGNHIQALSDSKGFIITASIAYKSEMENMCNKYGWKKGKNYISHLSIPRPEAQIQIGKDYKDIVQKLLIDMPELCSILIDKNDQEILKDVNQFIPCRVDYPDDLYPSYEKMLNLLETGRIDTLEWKYHKVFDILKNEKDKPCLCWRIFPIINRDWSTSICHLFPGVIIGDFHGPLTELIARRENHPHCRLCRKYGLHRLDIQVLMTQYSEEELC